MKAADATILLVEDVASMRTIIRTILRAAGVQRVLQAGDGAEALTLLRERSVESHYASGPRKFRRSTLSSVIGSSRG